MSEIFVRVNSGGVPLKQNDFILTLLSLYWDDGRREIEAFSKESTAPAKGKTTSYNQITVVEPQDIIRVVIAYAFDRARLKYILYSSIHPPCVMIVPYISGRLSRYIPHSLLSHMIASRSNSAQI